MHVELVNAVFERLDRTSGEETIFDVVENGPNVIEILEEGIVTDDGAVLVVVVAARVSETSISGVENPPGFIGLALSVLDQQHNNEEKRHIAYLLREQQPPYRTSR